MILSSQYSSKDGTVSHSLSQPQFRAKNVPSVVQILYQSVRRVFCNLCAIDISGHRLVGDLYAIEIYGHRSVGTMCVVEGVC